MLRSWPTTAIGTTRRSSAHSGVLTRCPYYVLKSGSLERNDSTNITNSGDYVKTYKLYYLRFASLITSNT